MTNLMTMKHLKIVPPVCEAWVANGGKISKVMKTCPGVRSPTDVLVHVSAASVNPIGKIFNSDVKVFHCV